MTSVFRLSTGGVLGAISGHVSKRFVASEIGGTKLQLVVGGESAKVLERKRLAVEPAQGAAGIRHLACYRFIENPEITP